MSTSTRDVATIRSALTRLLAWPELARSPQLSGFLRYTVKAVLDGTQANVKAYAIAVDVFGRGADFDPQRDPIVRVQARRLRALLTRYYESDGADAPVRFTFGVGSYVPEITFVASATTATGPATGAEAPLAAVESDDTIAMTEAPAPPSVSRERQRSARRRWQVAGLAVAAVLAGAGAVTLVRPVLETTPSISPETTAAIGRETLVVASFVNFTGNDQLTQAFREFGLLMAGELATGGPIAVIVAPASGPGAGRGETIGEEDAFWLAGIARDSVGQIEVMAILTRGREGPILWSATSRLDPEGSIEVHLAAIAADFVRQVATVVRLTSAVL